MPNEVRMTECFARWGFVIHSSFAILVSSFFPAVNPEDSASKSE
jgi:hypothetical protein